ncbi:MAG: beta-galactosidase [Streptococcus pyogenes]|nr:MAG: beta-galactosidase [Streptococcus pyogenes]
MERFEIKENFYLDGQPFKILSGAIHYFRIHPDDWYRSLYNLKALGFNTVETYVPWNLHEPKEGQFDFSQALDLEAFLNLAQELGLYAIVRPSPYICAEWEFGGLPAWLIPKKCRLRSSDPQFLAAVANYYQQLLPRLIPHQLDQGGNILMMQIENEYGSYGEEKAYLRAIRKLLEAGGVTTPLFTSDGPWQATLRAGSLIEDDVFVTGNFGSKAKQQFQQMRDFFAKHHKQWPLMCMEFWDGWFNRWGEPVIKRDPKETAQAIMEVLEYGSINLYMFHGGTNFGFMNGCSARKDTDLPQVTSYDYDAILDESGQPTVKFYCLQDKLKKRYPERQYLEPLLVETMQIEALPVKAKTSLFANLETISHVQHRFYPENMEALGHAYGYILYRTALPADKADQETIRLIASRDRAHIFMDQHWQATQYQDEIGDPIELALTQEVHQLDILMENMGRVNYGHKLAAPSQSKGLGRGVMADLHYLGDWQIYPLAFDRLDQLDFTQDWQADQPSFYRFDYQCSDPKATYLDLSGFGKGLVFVNQVNIGRFWDIGPTLSLYIPKGLLRKGRNTIIIFETEGRYQDSISFVKAPLYHS